MIIYKTTNKANGKFYIGQDRYNNSSYLGSGLLLERAIKKYGKENFGKEILENCQSLDELNEKEKVWIKKLNSANSNIGYNITLGGSGGDTISNNPRNKEIRENKSEKNIEFYKDKTNHPAFGKTCSEESNRKRSKALQGIKRSEETKKKQSIAASGKNNSMAGKSLMDVWINKYGEEEAQIRYTKWKKDLSKPKRKRNDS